MPNRIHMKHVYMTVWNEWWYNYINAIPEDNHMPFMFQINLHFRFQKQDYLKANFLLYSSYIRNKGEHGK